MAFSPFNTPVLLKLPARLLSLALTLREEAVCLAPCVLGRRRGAGHGVVPRGSSAGSLMAGSVPSFVPPANGKSSMGSLCSCLPFESTAGSMRVCNLFILDDYSGHCTRASIRLEEGVESGRDRKELEHMQNRYGCSCVTGSCEAYISVCVLNEYGERASI